jgi:hypothetical protein
VQVRDEQAEAQAVAATVSAEEAEVAAQTAKCKALKDDATADLVRPPQTSCCSSHNTASLLVWLMNLRT